jgi:hypothetical protein
MIGVDHNKLAGFVDYEHIHEDGLIGLVPMFLRNPFTQVGTNWTGMSFGLWKWCGQHRLYARCFFSNI